MLFDIEDLQIYAAEPSSVQSQHLLDILSSMGVKQTQLFESGSKLLEQMKQKTPDVVISCMYMPDMTGAELVQKIRAQDWGTQVAFILISSETNPRYLEPVRQNGSSAILRKPYELNQLKQALHASLDFVSPDPDEFNLGDEVDFDVFKTLVVDDSRVARTFIRQVLENLGMQNFVEAENGKQAAELIQQQRFDLVVTDYNMPEMDGRELTEFIRLQSVQSDIPILMVSSESNEGRLAAIQQAGISGVCDKPFEPNVVKRMLEKMLLNNDN